MRIRKVDLVLISILLLVLTVLIFGVIILREESSQCIQDPIRYGVDHLALASGMNVACSCYGLDSPSEPIYIVSDYPFGNTIDKDFLRD